MPNYQITNHYAPWTVIEKIIESGYIRVSESERMMKVKTPAVWLSADKKYEPTAIKMIQNEFGGIEKLTFKKMVDLFGAGRIVVPELEGLVTWAKYKYCGCTSLKMYEAMEKVGIMDGADPKNWYALFRNIPSNEWLKIEKWNGKEFIELNV